MARLELSQNLVVEPIRFILICLADWSNREQQAVIEYLREEVRVLRELRGKRPRFSDIQRRRLATKAKKIRYGRLKEIANVVTPDTLLRWSRKLIAAKYDSSSFPRSGRLKTTEAIEDLTVRMAQENGTWATHEFAMLCPMSDTRSVGIRLPMSFELTGSCPCRSEARGSLGSDP